MRILVSITLERQNSKKHAQFRPPQKRPSLEVVFAISEKEFMAKWEMETPSDVANI